MIKNRELLIELSPDFIRAAILEDGTLCELHSEPRKLDGQTETLFYGRVQAIRPSMQAAFIDIGQAQNAFLPLDEGESLRGGQDIIVQGAARQAVVSKGLRVSRRINLAGRWLVLIPGDTGVRISKKVRDDALRRELLEIGKSVCPQGCGLIVRTATEDVSAQKLREEADTLSALWQQAQKKARGMTRPGVLYSTPPLHLRLLRDLSGTLARVVISGEEETDTLEEARRENWLPADTRVERFDEKSSLFFDVYGIEAQIDKMLKKRVWLPCGGYLILDICEAMLVIDVNSGKMTLGRNMEDTALRVNLEAVQEIARQLRLRDIGGIVVVDLIDMQSPAHREQVLACMREMAAHDRSTVTVEGITRLGLLELTRKRRGQQLSRALRVSCSYCGGAGEVLSAQETARRAMMQVRRMALSGQIGPFIIRCAPGCADALRQLTPPVDYDVYALPMKGRHANNFEVTQAPGGQPLPQGIVRLIKGSASTEDSKSHR